MLFLPQVAFSKVIYLG